MALGNKGTHGAKVLESGYAKLGSATMQARLCKVVCGFVTQAQLEPNWPRYKYHANLSNSSHPAKGTKAVQHKSRKNN